MHLWLVLDMARAGIGDRVAVTGADRELSYDELAELSAAAAARFTAASASSVVYLGGNDASFPVALFGAAAAGIPLVPLNYRLGPVQLAAQLDEQKGGCVLHDRDVPLPRPTALGEDRIAFLEGLNGGAPEVVPGDPEDPALLLYTSGTTSAPKAAVLRHRHLMAYVVGTVEFAGADPSEATLVSAPPYHIAGVANLVSNLYAGRRIVYLPRFDPAAWLATVREQGVTHAMVVPTMLGRIVQHLRETGSPASGTPTLRSLSYGGARMPIPVLRRALELFPEVDFVNAYGLTETSSTIAVLGPEEHRAALDRSTPEAERRLASVGRLVPGVELQVRNDEGEPLPPGEAGLLFVRGEQVSGEYRGASALDQEGWFPTRDRGWVDEEGYLFLEGRADDTIIRGGENIAPAEIEDVLLAHPGVTDAVVVGIPDEEWGQRLAAAVVLHGQAPVDPDELRTFVRQRLRSSKTPDQIVFWPELPRTDTGKLLRGEVVAELS